MSTSILQLFNLYFKIFLSLNLFKFKFTASFKVNNLAILLNIIDVLHLWKLL